MSPISDLGVRDGLGLAELVRNGAVSPVELVDDAIERIEELNPSTNAVMVKLYDQARAAAGGDLPAGPFRGVPFLLKDLLVHHAGVVTGNGSRFPHDDMPAADSELVRRFGAAGLVTVGKTNTSEYGLMPVTEPEATGATNNPWELTRTAGGPSGGAAAAVAAGMVPLAHGSDAGAPSASPRRAVRNQSRASGVVAALATLAVLEDPSPGMTHTSLAALAPELKRHDIEVGSREASP